MKKMLRTVSALLFASSLALSLSACAGAKSETAAQSEVLRTIPETDAPTAAPETTAAETTAAPETKAAETAAAPETTAAPETSVPETAAAPDTSAEETESAAPEDAPVTHIHAYLKSESFQDFDRDPWKQFAAMTAVYPLLSEEDEALYPELAKALKDSMEQETAENAESFRELSKMAREYLQEGEAPYEDMTKAEVVRADSNAFSVRFFNYSYEGGVHGYYFNYGRTWDPATGKLLKLDDVVTDLERLKEIIIPLLREKYEGDVIDGLEETFAQYDADSFCWNLTPAGLDLYFNPYDIAAFASGQQFLTLTFADHPDLFKEPFAKSTDAHIIPINTEAAVRAISYDLGHDGSTNEILVLPELSSDNNDEYIGYTVRIDDRDFLLTENDSWYYSTPAMYLVHTADGGDFLWLFLKTDNDYVYLDVVNLAEGKAV